MKRIRKKLEESEIRFKSLIENSSDGITLTDEFSNVIYRSPGSQKITGNLPTENIISRTHPDDLEALKNIHARILSNPGIPFPFYGRFLHELGNYIWLEGTFTNMLHIDGVNAIVANYRDVTKRKELEALLHKSYELARIGSWEIDFLKETVYWSEITKEIHETETDFVPDLATGLNFYKEGSGRELMTQKVKEAIEPGKAWDEELQIITAKNNERWVRTIGEAEFVDGKCVRIYGSFQDISERKNAERLKEFEKTSNEALINSTEDAIWSVSKGFKLTAANKAFYNSIEKAVGKTLQPGDELLDNKIYPDGVLSFWEACYKTALQGSTFKKELYIPAFNSGAAIWLEVSFNPIYTEDNIIGIACYSRNITEGKLAAEKIKESEARLAASQSVAKVGSWETDLNNLDVTWSDEACRIFGVDNRLHHTTHENFLKFVHPDDKEKVNKAFTASFTSDSVNSIEHRIIADGIIKEIEERWLITRDENGKPIRALGTVQDITERKKAEQMISESEKRYRQIVETAQEGIWLIDENHKTTLVNSKMCEIFEYTEAEMMGKDIYFFMDEEGKQIAAELMDLKKAGHVGQNYFKYIAKSGKEIWTNLSANALFDEKGTYKGSLAMVTDITESKKDEKRNQFQATVLNTIGHAAIATDIQGRINFWNKAASAIYGWTEEEVLGKNIIDVTPIQQTKVQAETVMQELLRGNTWSGEFMVQRKDGSEFPAFVTNSPIYNQQQQLIAIVGISADITERKKVEHLLQVSEARYRKAQSLGKMGHWETDLKTNQLIWSDEIYRIFGLDKSITEIDLDTFLHFIHPDDLNDFKIAQQNALTGKSSLNFSHRIILKDGTIRHVHERGELEYNDQGVARYLTGTVQDITDRKIAEEEITNTEKKFRALIQNSTDGLTVIAADGTVLDMSPSGKKILGYDKNEIIGNNRPDLIHPDDRSLVMGAFTDIIKDPATIKLIEYRHNMPDGTYKWLECSYNNLLNEPYINAIVLSYRDITERKKAEEEIRSSEIRLIKAQQIGKFGYWQQNLKSDMVWASKEAMRIYGFEALDGELEREKIASCIIDIDKVKDAATNLVAHGKEYNIEIRINPADGSPMKYISVLAELEKNEQGEPVRIVGTLQDITERKKAESKLVENENYLRTILDSEPECVKVLNRKGELQSMNPAGLAMIQADDEQQVLGRRMIELIDEKYRADFTRLSKEVFNGNSGTFEYEVTGLKGGHRWLETHAVPLKNAAGKIINLLGLTRDITGRKKAEDELINTNEQLRQLTAHLQGVREEERKRIAREIHDELGQQLTAIKMDTVWIDKQIPAETIAVKNKLQNIIELLDGSHQSVRKILNELRPAVLDDNSLPEVLQWQGRQFTEITGTPLYFTTDQSSLKLPQEAATCIFRVYQEALTNIMRYAGAAKVLSSLYITDGKIILAIEDDGKGFDTGLVENKKRFGLLGMEERVLALNGAFSLVSSPGKGTKIVISLPYENI